MLIDLSLAERNKIPIKGIDTVVIHRIGTSIGTTALDICGSFHDGEVGSYTGYKLPYHIIVEPGQAVQALPLSVKGYHAAVWNPRSIGIAFIGDFRTEKLPITQFREGVRATAAVLSALGLGVQALAKHDELPGGSSDPDKKCPGDLFPWDKFVNAVADLLAGENIAW